MIELNKFETRINKFCSVDELLLFKEIGINYNEVIFNLCFKDIQGKKIGFEFYRKIILGGYYEKCFEFEDEKLSLIKLITRVILSGEIEYLNNKTFKDNLIKLLLNCINNNKLSVEISDDLILNIIQDINLCFNKEMERINLIRNNLGDNLNEELWVKVLKNKNQPNKKLECFEYDIFIEDCLNWNIIGVSNKKQIESIIEKYL